MVQASRANWGWHIKDGSQMHIWALFVYILPTAKKTPKPNLNFPPNISELQVFLPCKQPVQGASK